MSRAIRAANLLLLLSGFVVGVILAADPPVPPPAGAAVDPPIAADRLAVQTERGESIPFADLLGADGRGVCFAFLHPACPLAQTECFKLS